MVAAFVDIMASLLDTLVTWSGSGKSRSRSGGVISLLPPLPNPPVKARR
jgi:hypothetical protein